MRPAVANHLINPDFSFTDFGTAGRSTSGYVVPRWKLELSGGAVCSATPSTLPSDIGQPKWLRSKTGLTLNATTLPGGSHAYLRQRIEAGEKFSRQPARISIVLYGPDGGRFRYGIGDTYEDVTTIGPTDMVVASYFKTIDDPSTEYLMATLEPLTTGSFQVAFVQVDWPDELSRPASFELRSRQTERQLLNRYVYPLRRGLYVATAATTHILPITFPVSMRVAPSLEYAVTTIDLAEIRSGNATQITSAVTTVLDSSTGGCRVRFTGTNSVALSATDGYLLTDNGVVLNADY